MFINHSSKEVTAKVVYYGPGLSGKTTNLQYIFSITNPKTRGELISIETEIERTLFFDLLPINVGLINGYQTKFQLYTVPGQVFYDSTRKLVLKGADGVVFVADSQELMKTANLESFENLKKNLLAHKLNVTEIPLVFQYNKRDLNNTLPVEEMDRMINHDLKYPYFSAVATDGEGVVETLRAISGLILKKIKNLLDHSNRESSPQAQTVQFDTDKKYNVFDQDNVPLKKIIADDLENVDLKLDPLTPDTKTMPVAPPSPAPAPEPEVKPVTITETPTTDKKESTGFTVSPPIEDQALPFENIDDDDEDLLTVETLGPMDEYRDLEELVLGEDISEVVEVPDVEEINLGTDIEELSFEESQEDEIETLEPMDLLTAEKEYDTNEMFQKGNLDSPVIFEDLPEPPDTNEEPVAFELGEITDGSLTEVDELVDLQEIYLDDDEIQFPSPDATEKKQESQPSPVPGPIQPPSPPEPKLQTPIPSQTPAPRSIESIEDIQKLNAETKVDQAARATVRVPTAAAMDIFDQLQDKTRITVIRKLQAKDLKQLLIDVKGNDSNVLDSVKVELLPDTKKVTLIFDVKK